MKWIKGLKDPVLNGKGSPVTGADGKPIEKKEPIMSLIYEHVSKDPVKAIRKTSKILPMIMAAKNAIEMEDEDWEIVKEAVEANVRNLEDGAWGQLLALFKEGE